MRPTFIQANIKTLKEPSICEICGYYYVENDAGRESHMKLNQHKKAVYIKRNECTIRYGSFTIKF